MATLISEIKDAQTLVNKLNEYQTLLDSVEQKLQMEGQRLEALCKQHPLNYVHFKRKLNELKIIEEYYNTQLDKVYGDEYKKLNERRGQALSSSDIKAYIHATPEYISTKELVLEIAFIRAQYDAVVEAIEAMGYSLNNITKIRVADMERAIL